MIPVCNWSDKSSALTYETSLPSLPHSDSSQARKFKNMAQPMLVYTTNIWLCNGYKSIFRFSEVIQVVSL
jgi:hypothetical protein